jgi:large subunit ribosomal protein L35
MPKLKTNKALSKRIKVTGSGKLMHLRPGRGHLLSKKSESRKRQFTLDHSLEGKIVKTAKKMLGVS